MLECNKVLKATHITHHTLVGVLGNTFPRKGGNCFGVALEDGRDVQIVNFILENLQELLKRGLKWPIKVELLTEHEGIVIDERIPDNWYNDAYCSVCTPFEFLNHCQKKKHERAIARGDIKIHVALDGTRWTSHNVKPNPIFDYVNANQPEETKSPIKVVLEKV